MMMLPMTVGCIDHMSKAEKAKYLRRILAILVLTAATYGCVLVLSMLIAGPVLMHSLGKEGAMIGMILSWIVVAVGQWWLAARLL